jgi:hypothetical protein
LSIFASDFGKGCCFPVAACSIAQSDADKDILRNDARVSGQDKRVRAGNIDGPIVDSCHYDGAFVHEPIAQLIVQAGSGYAVRPKMKSEL